MLQQHAASHDVTALRSSSQPTPPSPASSSSPYSSPSSSSAPLKAHHQQLQLTGSLSYPNYLALLT